MPGLLQGSLEKKTEIALAGIFRLVGILLAAFLLIWLLRVLTHRLVALAKTGSRAAVLREQQTRTLAGILYSGGTAVIVVMAVLTALPEFGVNIAPIAAATGLVSLGIGFGAQNLVRDFISGFFIVFEDQYGVGDWIHVGDVQGRVEYLTLRRTVLRDPRGALVTIPNGEIRQVANLSRDWTQVFLDVTLPPDEPVSRALEAVEKVSSELRADAAWSEVLVDGPRVLGVESLAPGGTALRVMARTAPMRHEELAREFRRRVKARFEEEKISLSGTQRVEVVRETDKS
jgi:small conductance mechanosensitive channel